MKIKYLRPFRLYNPIGDAFIRDEGTVEDMGKEDYACWLIDNGFAEEVKESGWWKPKKGNGYHFLSNAGETIGEPWLDSEVDEFRYLVGNCFKTKDATERYRDYLKAIATVRQDEGVLTPEQVEQAEEWDCFWYVALAKDGRLEVRSFDDRLCHRDVGAILFDDIKHARDSLDSHPDEWKIIANYDWSRE